LKPYLVCAGLFWIGIGPLAWSADSWSMRIQVVDADEHPMKDARVSLSITGELAVLREVKTGEDGLALFEDLAYAASYEVRVAKADYGTVVFPSIELPAGRPISHPWKLPVTLRCSETPPQVTRIMAIHPGKRRPLRGDTFYIPVVLAGAGVPMLPGHESPDVSALAACSPLTLTSVSEEGGQLRAIDHGCQSRTLMGLWLDLMFWTPAECREWLKGNEPPRVENKGATYTLIEPAATN
jgi:hypothetical protein